MRAGSSRGRSGNTHDGQTSRPRAAARRSPVAVEAARVLEVPFDVFLVRKLGVPGHPELAMGAIAEGGVRVLTHRLIAGWVSPLRPSISGCA